jgi:hypothetical protein
MRGVRSAANRVAPLKKNKCYMRRRFREKFQAQGSAPDVVLPEPRSARRSRLCQPMHVLSFERDAVMFLLLIHARLGAIHIQWLTTFVETCLVIMFYRSARGSCRLQLL